MFSNKDLGNEQFACGRTLLHYAVFHKKDALIIWLLEQAELDVDLPDQFAHPALFDAIRHNRQVATVQHLIDRGADCNYRNKYGFTPLYWACMHADEKIIACLLQQPELTALESLRKALADGCLDRDDCFKQENLLALATKTGRQDVVDMQVLKSLKNFLELHLRNCKVLDYPILVTILENNPELRILSLTGCDNLKGDYYGSIDILSNPPHLEQLELSDNKIEALADWWGREWVAFKFSKLKRLNLRNCPLLKLMAIEAPSLERLQISNCQNLEEKAIQNLLQQSIQLTHLELVGFDIDFLVRTNQYWGELSYIELFDRDGNSALIWAAEKGLAGVCARLISRMSDAAINAATEYGDTALSSARDMGHPDIVK